MTFSRGMICCFRGDTDGYKDFSNPGGEAMPNKVEICGINTSRLEVLSAEETDALLRRSVSGDRAARERLISCNLRLVLRVIQRFSGRGESMDDLFQVGVIGLIKAIDNFNLPKDYTPDSLVRKLIDKYYIQNITEAGVALEALQKSIHLVSIAAVRINEQLNRKLSGALADEDITSILTMMDAVSKRITEIPALTKALGTAYENLRNEEEEQLARGGKQILSSMDADED